MVLRSMRAAVTLLMVMPTANTFSSQVRPVPIDGLCAALVSFANEGCTKATPLKPNEAACVAEFEDYEATGDRSLGEKEVKAAIDAVPVQLAKALKAVDVKKGCVGEQVSRIVQVVQEGKRRLAGETIDEIITGGDIIPIPLYIISHVMSMNLPYFASLLIVSLGGALGGVESIHLQLFHISRYICNAVVPDICNEIRLRWS